MPDPLGAILGWAVPIIVVFGCTAIALLAIGWAVRRSRRSPKARAAAAAERDRAGALLVRLDDAVAELDLEVGLSGALYGGGAPSSLRRARLQAQHVRDDAFDEFRALTGEELPADVRRSAARIERQVTQALAAIDRAAAEHREWMRAHVTASDQISAARSRLAHLRSEMGDPSALVAELSTQYDESEWQPAARAARDAVAEANDATRLLDTAARNASDPARDALADLAVAERSLRAAEGDARTLEETHRLVTQAAQALPDEIANLRTALRQALTVRGQLEPDAAERLSGELKAVETALTELEKDAARRPTHAVDQIARLRYRLDLAVGDANSAQQRLRGARTALPGTLAAARSALAQAEAAVAHTHAGADARARLISAQRELAAARQSQDPVDALDAARRSMRHAEDAKALADYARLAGH